MSAASRRKIQNEYFLSNKINAYGAQKATFIAYGNEILSENDHYILTKDSSDENLHDNKHFEFVELEVHFTPKSFKQTMFMRRCFKMANFYARGIQFFDFKQHLETLWSTPWS